MRRRTASAEPSADASTHGDGESVGARLTTSGIRKNSHW